MKSLTRPAGVLAVAGFLLLGAGCGGGAGDGSAPPPTSSAPPAAAPPPAPGASAPAGRDPAGDRPTSAAQVQQRLDDCLRKEGFAKPPASYDGLSPKEQAAVRKCGLAVLGAGGSGTAD